MNEAATQAAPKNPIDFSDLEGDFASETGKPPQLSDDSWRSKHDFTAAAGREAKKIEETCPKCRGRGYFVSYSGRSLGDCFRCKGKKVILVSKPLGQRLADKAKRDARKVGKLAKNWEAFQTAQPRLAAWMVAASARGFNFAGSMIEAVKKYGELTDKQLLAVAGCVEKDEARAAERATAKAAVDAAPKPQVDVSRMILALNKAHDQGLRKPFLLTESFTFSRAPDTGKNPDAIYVTRTTGGDSYLGKIVSGSFFASRECDAATTDSIVSVCADPLAAAIAYGKATGVCSCCGRELTNEESVSLGIGPICRRKYF